MPDRLAILFGMLPRPCPEPPIDRAECCKSADQRRPVKMKGGQDEHAAECSRCQHRLGARSRQPRDLYRPRIQHARDNGLTPHFLGIGQKVAALVDLAHEILLVPDWVPAFDQRDRAYTPILVLR